MITSRDGVKKISTNTRIQNSQRSTGIGQQFQISEDTKEDNKHYIKNTTLGGERFNDGKMK